VHLSPILVLLTTLLAVAVIACAAAWIYHLRHGASAEPPQAALLSTLEEHGDRLRALHEALGDERARWEDVEVDVRRRILAADVAVQAHAYGRRRTDTYALRGTRDGRGHGEAPT
jgi:hypothetical protein